MLHRQIGCSTDPEFIKNSIHPLHMAQIQTLFAKIASGSGGNTTLGRDRITILGLRDLGYMLGQKLTDEEWTIVAQEGLEDNDRGEMIILDKVVSCIEKMQDDTKNDPYNLLKKLLEDASRYDDFINPATQKVDLLAFKYSLLIIETTYPSTVCSTKKTAI